MRVIKCDICEKTLPPVEVYENIFFGITYDLCQEHSASMYSNHKRIEEETLQAFERTFNTYIEDLKKEVKKMKTK